jgi:hypothetical protein
MTLERGLAWRHPLATDRPKKQPLLALAQLLMPRCVCGRDELVRLRKAVLDVAHRVMDAKGRWSADVCYGPLNSRLRLAAGLA